VRGSRADTDHDTLTTIRPFNVSEYIEALQQTHSPPAVKQQLAAVRMLFDWLITGQVVPINPASAVRGPKHVVKTGKTPVLDAADWRKLLDTIPTDTVRDLRDRALIATLTYSFARITAALSSIWRRSLAGQLCLQSAATASGRCRPSAFGMYRRREGCARYAPR
jgi:site-specific recombinase XerC